MPGLEPNTFSGIISVLAIEKPPHKMWKWIINIILLSVVQASKKVDGQISPVRNFAASKSHF